MSANASAPLSVHSKYKMHSGHEIPKVGLGVYLTPSGKTKSVVLDAFKSGYRHVDSAQAYGNEQPCGDAIRTSGLKREDLFFTSKIPPNMMGYDKAKQAIDSSLAKTGLDYIDLYLIHTPWGGKDGRLGSWRALVEAQKAGKVRSIGVSNYGVHHLDELEQYISSSGVGGKIDVGQWELHPWLPHHDIVEWASKRGVVMQAWAPLVQTQRANDATLQTLGKKHGKTWAQILVRWSLQKGFVPLPKSVRAERIAENIDVFDFELTSEDMKSLDFPKSYEPCSLDLTTDRS